MPPAILAFDGPRVADGHSRPDGSRRGPITCGRTPIRFRTRRNSPRPAGTRRSPWFDRACGRRD